MAAILFPGGETIPLDTGLTTRLARLGVTTVALLADEGSTCLVVDGWSFDIERSSLDLIQAVAGTRSVRLLRAHAQMALTPTIEGDRR